MKKLLTLWPGIAMLLLVSLTTVSTSAIAQTVTTSIRFKLSGVPTLGSVQRDLSIYPDTPAGEAALKSAIETRKLNVTITSGNRAGQILAALLNPTAPNSSTSALGSGRYTYNSISRALDVEFAPYNGAATQFKLETVSGQSLQIQSSGNQPLQVNTYYLPGPLTGLGDWIQEWSFRQTGVTGSGVPMVPIRGTWKRTSDGATFSYVFTPSDATRQVLFTAANTSPPPSQTVTTPTTPAPSGYGNIYAANSTYQALAPTPWPSGTDDGRQPWRRSFIENGVLKLGFNLSAGAMLDWTSWNGGENFTNTPVWDSGKLDGGRSNEPAWYAYPSGTIPTAENQIPAGQPGSAAEGHYEENGQSTVQVRGATSPSIGWNLVNPGDEGHNPNYSTIFSFGNDGQRLYKSVSGMQWHLRNVPGKAKTETWLSFDPTNNRVFRTHIRLNMARIDPYASHYPTPRQQELPCWYTVTDYSEYYICQGRPYTNAPLTRYYTYQRGVVDPPQLATEPAIYARNPRNGRVMVMFAPHSGRFTAGDFNTENKTHTVATENSCMYLAATPLLSIDPNGVYDFDVAEGEFASLEEARAWVYTQPRWDGLVNVRFDNNVKSRSGWIVHHGKDQLEKNITDGLVVEPLFDNEQYGKDLHLAAPERWIDGRQVKGLRIQAAITSSSGNFAIRFKRAGDNAEYYRSFTMQTNGSMQTYTVDMSSDSRWNGSDIISMDISHDPTTGPRPAVTNDKWIFKSITSVTN